jgi:hypothetical protein
MPSAFTVQPRSAESAATRRIAELAFVCIGAALVACAIAANQQWLDRHFLPSWFLPRRWYVAIETGIRVMIACAGVGVAVVVRPRAGRFLARSPSTAVAMLLAVMLAVAASEMTLRRMHIGATEWLVHDEEPRRQPDPRIGWTFVPSRAGHSRIGGRVVEYAFDSAGYRVRRVDEPVAFDPPTIVFAGESVMFGEGLTWEESVPAQVGAMTGVQSANLAVHGYATDQAYLRLQSELPRFQQPLAVVFLFMTPLFGRNLDEDRPHLGPGLTPLAPEAKGRLMSLAKQLVPYRSDATVRRGVAVTREVLRATIDLVRARGAVPLIVVPHFGAEDETERALRRTVLDDGGVPYLWVEIDEGWRLPWDRHPNAHAARVMAAAIAARLTASLRLPSSPPPAPR